MKEIERKRNGFYIEYNKQKWYVCLDYWTIKNDINAMYFFNMDTGKIRIIGVETTFELAICKGHEEYLLKKKTDKEIEEILLGDI